MGKVVDFPKNESSSFNQEFWDREKNMEMYLSVSDDSDRFIAETIRINMDENNIELDDKDIMSHKICKNVLLGIMTSVLISVIRFFGKELGRQIVWKSLNMAEKTIAREDKNEDE